MFHPRTGKLITTGTKVDTTPAIPRVLDLSLDAVGNVEQGDGIALAGLCTVFTKASIAASLPDGPRLENLAWRLWGWAHVSTLAPGLLVKQLSPAHPPTHPIPAISPHSPSLHLHPADSGHPPNPHTATSSPNLDSLASPAPVPFISASTFTFATGKGAPAVPGGMTSSSACRSEPASTSVNIDTSSGLISKSRFTSAFASVSDATVSSVARGARATDSLAHNGLPHNQAPAYPLSPSYCPSEHNQSATTPHLHSKSDHHPPVGPYHYTEDQQHNEQDDRVLPAIVPVALPMNILNTNTMNMDTAEFGSESVPVQSSPHHIAVQPCDSELRHFGSHPLTVKHLPPMGRTNPVVDGHVERVTIKDGEVVAHICHQRGTCQDKDAHQEQDERQHQHDLLRASRMHIALPVTRSTPETWPDLGRGAKTRARDQEPRQSQEGRAEAVGVALRHHESHEGVAEGGVMHVVPPGPDHQEAVAVGGCLTPGLTPFERDACVLGPASESEPSQALKPGNAFGSSSTGVAHHEQFPAYNTATGMATQVFTATMGVRIAPTSERVSAPLPLKQGAPTLARLMRRLFGDVDSRVPLKIAEPGSVARVDSTSPLSTSTAISLSLSTSTPTSTPSTSATTTSLSSTIASIAGDAPAPASASTRASPTIRPAALPLPFPTVIVVNPTPHPTPPATPSPPTGSNSYFRYDTGISNTFSAVNETNTIPSYNIYSTSTTVLPDGPLSVSLSNLGNGQLATPTSIHSDTRESEFFPDVCNVSVSQSSGEAVPVTHPGINSETGDASIASDSISPPRRPSTSMPHVHLPLAAILTTDATSSGAVPSDMTLAITTPASISALIASTPEIPPLASLPAAQTTKPTSAYGPATSSFHISITPATTSAAVPCNAPPSASTNSTAPTSSATSTTVSSSTLPSTASLPASSLVEDKKFFLAAPHSIGSGGSEHSSESPDSVGGRFGKTELSGREVLGEGTDDVVDAREDVFHKTAAGRKASHRDSEVIKENISIVGREEIGRDEEACGSMSMSESPGVRSGLGRGVSSPVLGRVKGRVVGAGRRKGMKRVVVMKDERGVTQGQVGAEVGKVQMQKTLEQESQREDIAAKSKGERGIVGDSREGSRSSGALTELGIPAPARPHSHLKSMQQLPSNRLHTLPQSHTHLHTQHTNAHGQGHPYQAQNLRQLPTNPPRRHQSPAHRSTPAAASNAESGQGQGHVQGNDKGLMKSPTSNTDSSHSRTSASHSLRSRANAAGSSHARKHVQDPTPPAPATNTRHLPFHPQLSHLGLGHLPTVPPKQRRPIEITETSSEYETTDTEGDESSWESDSIDKEGVEDVGAVAKTGGGEPCADPSTQGRNAEEESAKNGPTKSNGNGAAAAGATKNGTANRTRDAGEFARDAALEAQRQRDLFQKLPERSYSNLAQLPRVKSGISRLFNPDPELFPEGHPYRTTRSSRDLLARNWSAPGPPLAMTAMNRAAAAAPMQAAVNAESVISSVNSTTVPGRSQDGHSAMQRGGYRPRLKPADQEEETDSGEEDPEDAIQVSSSVAHRRLAAIMRSRGTQSQQQSRLPQTTSNPTPTPTNMSQVPQPPSSQPLTRIPTEPILMMHPYLPDPAPLQTPHTVRRNIIAQELDETLRRNLLWERSQNQIQGRPPRAPGSILQGPWRRLTPLKPGESGGEPESQMNASDKAPGMRPFGTQRTKSWAGDFHASGW